MNSFYKIISFCTIGFILSFLSWKLQSDFANKFSENVLALLTTLFAINIASSTLIAGKIHEVQALTGHEFKNAKTNLKLSFYEQIIILFIAFIATLIRESQILKLSFSYLQLICDSLLFTSFIYYVDVIRDLGKALFELLDFKPHK